MYDRDPRREWTPLLAYYGRGLQPWQMEDLTPVELDSYHLMVAEAQKSNG